MLFNRVPVCPGETKHIVPNTIYKIDIGFAFGSARWPRLKPKWNWDFRWIPTEAVAAAKDTRLFLDDRYCINVVSGGSSSLYSCPDSLDDCYDFEGDPEQNPYYRKSGLARDKIDWTEPMYGGDNKLLCPGFGSKQYLLPSDKPLNQPGKQSFVDDGTLIGLLSPSGTSPPSFPPIIYPELGGNNYGPFLASLPAGISDQNTQGNDANGITDEVRFQPIAEQAPAPQDLINTDNWNNIDRTFGPPLFEAGIVRRRKLRSRDPGIG
ncbi:hypothetical protein MMC07_003120 [Pseudocyphellaria aurata]|nr:hypothetical protein [Pseudocyphellaria aurata]